MKYIEIAAIALLVFLAGVATIRWFGPFEINMPPIKTNVCIQDADGALECSEQTGSAKLIISTKDRNKE